MVRDLDTGRIFDARKEEHSKFLGLNRKGEDRIVYAVENLKILEKINTKFFKSCERGELEKVIFMLNRKASIDRKPNINEKYLHNYTVLHIAVTNCKK